MLRATLPCLLATLVAASAQSPDTANTLVVPRFDGVYAASARLVVFDGPDATETYASAIDSEGAITGMYADMTNAEHVYLRSLKGRFETFSAPGSPDITPDSINARGIVAGSYGDTRGDGFVRKPDGTFTTFTLPGVFPSSSTNPIVINNSGTVAGPYIDTNGKEHGFIRLEDGTFFTLDYPDSSDTQVTGINNSGSVTGIYVDASFNAHGFVRGPGGTWVSFDVPGNSFGFFTPSININDRGIVAGSYLRGTTQEGFLWQEGASLTSFAVSGAVSTWTSGINSSGYVTGYYQDSNFIAHGYIRSPWGTIYTFSAPDAAQGTFPVGINGKGDVAGYYVDANYVAHGFVVELKA
jgi:hypothetical protein